MSNSAFYLCLDTDAGEYELLSSHATRNEAYAALQELDAASVDTCRCSVQSVDTLEAHIESMIDSQFAVEMRIDRKETLCDGTRQARTIVRHIRDTLQGEAYLPLTEKYIELSDALEKGERYIANRRREVSLHTHHINSLTRNLERLHKAISNLSIENTKAINMMETRSRAVQMHDATNDDGP